MVFSVLWVNCVVRIVFVVLWYFVVLGSGVMLSWLSRLSRLVFLLVLIWCIVMVVSLVFEVIRVCFSIVRLVVFLVFMMSCEVKLWLLIINLDLVILYCCYYF